VMIGVLFMIMGNIGAQDARAATAQQLSTRFLKVSRMLRFGGKLFCGLGLAFVLGGILFPPEYWEPVFAPSCWPRWRQASGNSIKLRHERSLQ